MLFGFLFFILLLGFVFTRVTHPLSMGLVLLFQTCFVCLSVGLSVSSFWFSYILFLVFLGGLLVLFMYVASLASNEAFGLELSWSFFVILCLVLMVVSFLFDDLIGALGVYVDESSMSWTSLSINLTGAVYSGLVVNFTFFVILYLLLALYVSVEINTTKWAPLRLVS